MFIYVIPIIFLSSCGTQEYTLTNLPLHEYFVDKDIQDSSSRKHLVLGDLKRSEIKTVPQNQLGLFHSRMLSGTFGEERHFYTSANTWQTFHTGIDCILPQGQKIISPINGEIIASYWYNSYSNEFANGIGGVVVIKVNIEDLNIPKEYKKWIFYKKGRKVYKLPQMVISLNNIKISEDLIVSEKDYEKYIKDETVENVKKIHENEGKIILSFMHLSQESPKVFGSSHVKTKNWTTSNRKKTIKMNVAISPDHPKKIKRGELIGYVGSLFDNGGWSPHVHVNVYSSMSSLFTRQWKYKPEEPIDKTWKNLHPMGVYATQLLKNKPKKTETQIIQRLINNGYIDPNKIYQLYNEDTKNVSI